MVGLQRTCVVFLLGLQASLVRPRQSVMSATGLLVAAFGLVALLTLPAGMARLAARTGLPEVVVIVPQGGAGPAGSRLSIGDQLTALGNLPGVARDVEQRALVAAQLALDVRLRRNDGSRVDVRLRGVDPSTWAILAGNVHLVRGERFQTGVSELIAGRAVAGQFVGLKPGAHVMLRDAPWTVTGQFRADDSLWESELWMDLGALQTGWNAPGRVNEIWLRLESPDAFEAFDAALRADASLQGLTAVPQPDYYRYQIGFIQRFAQLAAWAVALVLGLGAALVVANALHLAFRARVHDSAVLRALGFRGHTIALALLLEVLSIAAVSAALAVALGWLLLDGRTFTTATASQSIQLSLRVGWQVAGLAFLYTMLLAVGAAAWPIWSNVHAPLLRALQNE